MRIGIVLSQPPGYSETFFSSKIKGLIEQGYSVSLFVQKKTTDFRLCEIKVAPKVYRFPLLQALSMLGVFFTLIPRLGKVMRFIQIEKEEGTSFYSILKKIYLNAHLLKADLDWVHFGFATQSLGSECVAKAIGAKMAVSFRGFDINIYPLKHRQCYNKTWKYVDKVHSISKYLYEKGISLGLSTEVPHHIITPAVQMATLPNRIDVNNTRTQIVTIARLNWIKGLETAISAIALLRKRGVEIEYHIIGEGSIKDTERYTFHAYEEGLQKQIKFHGALPHEEALQFLNRSDIYLQPSINEGFCNAVLEAQALGKFVVASNVGGLPENISNGKTGWLFPVGDPEALADLLEKIIAMPENSKNHQVLKIG
ncbi:MAG: glycosyltransferase family 4 protein [Flavobacteriaceae bacterium]|nr:glycosyltransferase family 4 protein [Flavobacteriaceae bacterium]